MLASPVVGPFLLVALVAFSPARLPSSGAPAAQPSFQRGLTALHNFQYEDAGEAFREAQGIDRDFAMAYWGEAMACNQTLWLNQDADMARQVLLRLGPTPPARAAKAKTEREKGYLRAVEVLFGSGDRAARDRAYAEEMRGLAKAYPEDPRAVRRSSEKGATTRTSTRSWEARPRRRRRPSWSGCSPGAPIIREPSTT